MNRKKLYDKITTLEFGFANLLHQMPNDYNPSVYSQFAPTLVEIEKFKELLKKELKK